MAQNSPYKGAFDKCHGKWAETVLKAERRYFYHIYWSLWRQIGLKKSLWVIWKVLGLFVNPFTADDKDSLLNRGSLLQHFQIQLYQKQKNFSEFFFVLSKFTFNFKHFSKTDEPHSGCICEFTDSAKRG